jgi:hypothetical protein
VTILEAVSATGSLVAVSWLASRKRPYMWNRTFRTGVMNGLDRILAAVEDIGHKVDNRLAALTSHIAEYTRLPQEATTHDGNSVEQTSAT